VPFGSSYRHERALLLLVAICALSFAYGSGWQDVSRLGLTQALALDGTLRIDRYASQTGDKARYGGHWYSDKAPGVSLVALPAFEAMRATRLAGADEEARGIWHRRGLLLVIRALIGGLAYVAATWLVGRAAERLRPGTGPPVAVTFALGTMALPLAATLIGHLPAGALAFAAFLLVSEGRGRRLAAAGGCAAAAVLFEYQAALIALIVLAYVVLRTRSIRSVAAYVLGGAPFALALGVYNLAAFGSPLHFSYRYESAVFPEQQHGFFGIEVPSALDLTKTLVGHRGLVLLSPVLLLGAAGLALLWRRGQRLEASVCSAVAIAFVVISAGYFDPYGGLSPGPRYFAPALLFLILGLAEAYTRWPRLTAVAAIASVGAMLFEAATYGPNFDFETVWSVLGLPRVAALPLVLAPAAAALALALKPVLLPARRRRGEATTPLPSRRSPGP
jgi:hypothetical protein